MTRRLLSFVVLLNALAPTPGAAADGSVVGWVEDAKGLPVAGALVSLFGRGLRGGGFVTLSDSSGRFVMPGLPAGSYTIRALGGERAATRQVTVLPNRDSIFTLSFAAAPQPGEIAPEPESAEARELRWLLRHKKRSVLESKDAEATVAADSARPNGNLLEALVPWVPELGGAVEWTAVPSVFGTDTLAALPRTEAATPNLGSLKLQGSLPGGGRWSLGGLLADSESNTWRMASEVVLEPGSGQQIQIGAGYGTRFLEPALGKHDLGYLENRSVGALFVHDRWRISEHFAAGLGARYTYVGFLADRNQLSPAASLEWHPDRNTRVKAESSSRTLTPGGDLLTLSTHHSAPAMTLAFIDRELRPETITRHELAWDKSLGDLSLGAFLFREGVRDRLVNILDRGPSNALRIVNGRGVTLHGTGLRFTRRFGDCLKGSLTYTFGRARPAASSGTSGQAAEAVEASIGLPLALSDTDFHDFTGRVETFLDWSDTRLVAYYRVNTQAPDTDRRWSRTSTRFEVQLAQGLPFLKSMTRAEWEVLVAVRNLFYEATEGATLDEMAIASSPKRVQGGVSVRF